MKIHPGGSKIMSSYIGKDASDAWVAMHPDKRYVNKFLKPLEVGNLIQENTITQLADDIPMVEKFRQIRQFAQNTSLYESSISFFLFQYVQIIILEICAWLNLYYCGVNVYSFLVTSLLITTAQAQAGWAQHDYGHLSVFNTRNLNKIMHQLIIGHLKGASSSWWNFRHNLHHTKPNIIKTDPDIAVPYLFLLGSKMPKEWAKKRRGFMPYNYQHNYFFFFGPPLLLPIYFHYENMYFILKRCQIKVRRFMVLFEIIRCSGFVLNNFFFYQIFLDVLHDF